LLMLVSGCATTTTETFTPIPVPDVAGSQQGVINVCRKYIFLADSALTTTSVDHQPVLRSTAGKCFSARLYPGGHTLKVVTQGIACPRYGQLDFLLDEGQTRYFAIKLDRIEEISQEEFADFDQKYTLVTVQ
jgi:hypothetical protein